MADYADLCPKCRWMGVLMDYHEGRCPKCGYSFSEGGDETYDEVQEFG
jgi:ribosomal protein S27AE